ncbi:hypothetical protein RhiirA4_481403 [Rhizophagus irregularis]|uniref:Uncharacterized protein n=1 Tax=Rhizophagus irregularis TaxID=588596 RepID=A0A2I1HJE6_9GLOM|nr:hypothetical protein RhiirA4_481403 [Rhizophagus irregularis]
MNNNNFINNGFNSNLQSEIFTFEIPGIKIIVIPTFSPMTNSSQTNHSEIFTFDIPGSKDLTYSFDTCLLETHKHIYCTRYYYHS